MSRIGAWRTTLAVGAPPLPWRDWLCEPGSLTARLQRHCRVFRVHVLATGWGRSRAEADVARLCRVREVMLECDGRPVIFAHTTLSTARRGRLNRWLARLGSRSLGSLLFTHPGFRRGPVEFCRLQAHHPLARRLAALGVDAAGLWARRSRHALGEQSVLVTEVFLSGLADLF